MKLALAALAIEIGLARLLVGSWLWAGVIVLCYCLYVYLKHVGLKKQKKGNSELLSDDGISIRILNGNRNKHSQFYYMTESSNAAPNN